MLFAFWSVKGGVGTSVIAAGAATMFARRDGSATVIDLDGDLAAILGVPEPEGPGICDWLHADAAVGVDALGRLEHEVGPGLRFIPRGRREPTSPERAGEAAERLAAAERMHVVDAGRLRGDEQYDGARRAMIEGASTSLLVLRPCYLALRRALANPVRRDGVVLVVEPGRAISRSDVVDVLGCPVVAEVAVDASVARAVDAGLLTSRLPADLARSLAHVG